MKDLTRPSGVIAHTHLHPRNRDGGASGSVASHHREILELQRSAGNRAVTQLIGQPATTLQRAPGPRVTPRTIPTTEEIDRRAKPIGRAMDDVISSWKEESRWGVQNFVNAELEGKIDEVRSSGLSAGSFLMSLTGNILWAAACFTTGGAAFGISLLGIAIAAAGSPPGDKKLADKGAISAMAEQVQGYLDTFESGLKEDAAKKVHDLVLFNQELDQVALLERFLTSSFDSGVLKRGPEGRLTRLDPGAVRARQKQALTTRWQHFKETVPLAGKMAGSEYTVDGRSDTSPRGGRLRLVLVQPGTPTRANPRPEPRWGLGLELWPGQFGIAKWVADDVRDDVDRRIREVAGTSLSILIARPEQVTVHPDRFWQTVEGIWVAP